jgi:hypothetical protein
MSSTGAFSIVRSTICLVYIMLRLRSADRRLAADIILTFFIICTTPAGPDEAGQDAKQGNTRDDDDDRDVARGGQESGSKEEDDAAAGPATRIFPFPTVDDDHCESPVEAYADIVPLLHYLQRNNNHPTGSTSTNLRIYDPYYCDGAVIRHLTSLGFPNVYNNKEDCYATWQNDKTNTLSQCDVLVTNPPYSGDHMERLLTFAVSRQWGDRPWFLLLPNFVHKKDYYQQLLVRAAAADVRKNSSNDNNYDDDDIRPFYLVPDKRYIYVPPKHFRAAKKSDVHKKSSPFVSMWYCWGGSSTRNEALIRSFSDFYGGVGGRAASSTEMKQNGCHLARSRSALRDLRRKR